MRAVRLAVPLLLLTPALAACGPGPGPERPPRIGAPTQSATAPDTPMDRLEGPVADRLLPRLERDGLHLEYVDCPPWSGRVPSRVECDGYVDGVVGEIEVRLDRSDDGTVEFDAWLTGGVVATSRLVERLEQEGWHAVDCGTAPAYPARPGLEIVCRVHEGGNAGYVVATVTDVSGEVRIREY